MTFDQITTELLSKPNCSTRCNLGYIENLHRFVQVDIEIVQSHPNPKKSFQCRELKKNLLYLLNNYDSIKKRPPNIKWK